MRTKIMHWGNRWQPPKNHLDGRVCPECFTTVHGNHAQFQHQQWHLDLQEVLDQISARAGIEAEQGPPAPWTAEVETIDSGELEAVD